MITALVSTIAIPAAILLGMFQCRIRANTSARRGDWELAESVELRPAQNDIGNLHMYLINKKLALGVESFGKREDYQLDESGDAYTIHPIRAALYQ